METSVKVATGVERRVVGTFTAVGGPVGFLQYTGKRGGPGPSDVTIVVEVSQLLLMYGLKSISMSLP